MADQRLMAMLADLEKGLRRAEAAEQIIGVSLKKNARPATPQRFSGAAARCKNAETLDRTVAVIVFVWVAGIVVSLVPHHSIWGPSGASVGEGGERVNVSAPAPLLETGARQQPLSSNDQRTTNARSQEDGLSVEEFERQVHRLLTEKRKRTQTEGMQGSKDYPVEPDYAFALSEDQAFPEPLAPPTAAKEDAKQAEPEVHPEETRIAHMVKMSKANAAGKPRKMQVVSKQATKPATPRAPREPSGPLSLVTSATNAISGMIKRWIP